MNNNNNMYKCMYPLLPTHTHTQAICLKKGCKYVISTIMLYPYSYYSYCFAKLNKIISIILSFSFLYFENISSSYPILNTLAHVDKDQFLNLYTYAYLPNTKTVHERQTSMALPQQD